MISLRKANVADAEAIAKVYVASRKEHIAFAPLVHSEESIYQWICETLIPTNLVTVAEEDGVIVGMMALSKNKGIGWIDQLYISPDSIGQGIGTLLVAAAKSTLGSPIRLHTFQQNIGARRFYERHGFQEIGRSDGSTNEERCPDVLYEWRE
ncbi:MAG: GNAT family N-acetyltransferase [Verrucomicrobia bacterium]|nr:GNAT family N-acetyltransferase [Verrucomicrobiota bacterium]